MLGDDECVRWGVCVCGVLEKVLCVCECGVGNVCGDGV